LSKSKEKFKIEEIYFVDCENLGYQSLGIKNYYSNTLIYYIRGEMNQYVKRDSFEDDIVYKHCPGKNTLDFIIDTFLGSKITEYGKDVKYIIVSNDHGFDHILKFWGEEGYILERTNRKQLEKYIEYLEKQHNTSSKKHHKNNTSTEDVDKIKNERNDNKKSINIENAPQTDSDTSTDLAEYRKNLQNYMKAKDQLGKKNRLKNDKTEIVYSEDGIKLYINPTNKQKNKNQAQTQPQKSSDSPVTRKYMQVVLYKAIVEKSKIKLSKNQTDSLLDQVIATQANDKKQIIKHTKGMLKSFGLIDTESGKVTQILCSRLQDIRKLF
jgi:hypothetical protein